jgi:hypothetical protein
MRTESPIDDLTYDVITVLQNKAKALEAYDKYIRDADEDDEAREAFEEMKRADQEHIRILKEVLARRLDDDLGLSDEEYEDEEDDEDFDAEDDDDDDDVVDSLDDVEAGAHRGEETAHVHGEPPPPRRGSSGSRRDGRTA